MDEKVQDKIKQAVHVDFDWKTEEVRVDEVDRLKRGPCSFYTAAHRVRPLSYQPNYAVLPGGAVIGGADDTAVTKILDACGADAPAGWQAEIVTRFHQDLGGGVVLQDEKQNAAAVSKVQAAGKKFAPPEMNGDGRSRKVTFYMLDPESFTVYAVQAARKPDGTVAVEKTELH